MPNLERLSDCHSHIHPQQTFSFPLSSCVFSPYTRITLWHCLCSDVCVYAVHVTVEYVCHSYSTQCKKTSLIQFWNLSVNGWWGIMTLKGFKECERQQKGFICFIWCNILVSTISRSIQCGSVAWLQHLCNLLGLSLVLLTFYHDAATFTLCSTGPNFSFGIWSNREINSFHSLRKSVLWQVKWHSMAIMYNTPIVIILSSDYLKYSRT